jgi:signal transduction histidine kinase
MPCYRAARSPGTARGLLLLLPGAGGLSGCSGAVPAVALQLSSAAVLLSLLVVAGLAAGMGALVVHARTRAALRLARLAERRAEQLRAGWRWQTDGQHRLVNWQAPGEAPQATCDLFDLPALQQRLAARQAFAGLRLRSAAAPDGHTGWELRALPCHGDAGEFCGFEGSARPTDDDDTMRLAAAALTPLLQANPLPVVLARHVDAGWQVQQLNPAAQDLWPQAAEGDSLNSLLSGMPALLSQAVALVDDGQPREAPGWRIVPLGPLPGGARTLLLARLADAPPPADAQSRESDNFTFTLSHDLRAPIRVVEGFTRIVKEDYGRLLDRVGNDHLERVLGAAARMNLMIDALLTLARLSQQPLARQRVNLSQLAAYVADDLRRSAPEREADIDIEPDLTAWGDPTLLRLVLENLLGNAWKYTGKCARSQISLRARQHGEQIAYVVRDNGAGFDMRSAERLFGLFQRLHSASDFPGHGVGLASVRRIVQRHGGEIWAEGEPGRGAAFHFTLAA